MRISRPPSIGRYPSIRAVRAVSTRNVRRPLPSRPRTSSVSIPPLPASASDSARNRCTTRGCSTTPSVRRRDCALVDGSRTTNGARAGVNETRRASRKQAASVDRTGPRGGTLTAYASNVRSRSARPKSTSGLSAGCRRRASSAHSSSHAVCERRSPAGATRRRTRAPLARSSQLLPVDRKRSANSSCM